MKSSQFTRFYNFKNNLVFVFFILFVINSIAQDTIPKEIGDLRYREDQFYISITYNLLSDTPDDFYTEGLSGSVNFGFIRDFPINKKRNIAIGAGLGFSFNQYGSNLFINKDASDNTIFKLLDREANFDYNRFRTIVVEAPIEFRFRGSTPTSYSFWRVYAGFRVGYSFWYSASFKDSSNSISHSDISEFDKLRLGATLSVGYNKFNLFAYYSLNPFFKDVLSTSGQDISVKTFKLGLVMYIL